MSRPGDTASTATLTLARGKISVPATFSIVKALVTRLQDEPSHRNKCINTQEVTMRLQQDQT